MTIDIKNGKGRKPKAEAVLVSSEELRQLLHHLLLTEFGTVSEAVRQVGFARATYYRYINGDREPPQWLLDHYGIKKRTMYQLSAATYRKAKAKAIAYGDMHEEDQDG